MTIQAVAGPEVVGQVPRFKVPASPADTDIGMITLLRAKPSKDGGAELRS